MTFSDDDDDAGVMRDLQVPVFRCSRGHTENSFGHICSLKSSENDNTNMLCFSNLHIL